MPSCKHAASLHFHAKLMELIRHVLMGQDISSAAGHLLDPNMEVGSAISRGLHPLMHDWVSRGNNAKDSLAASWPPCFCASQVIMRSC